MENNQKIVKKLTKPVIFTLCCVLMLGVFALPLEVYAYPDNAPTSAKTYVLDVIGRNSYTFDLDLRDFASNSSDGSTTIRISGERRDVPREIAEYVGYEAIVSSGVQHLGFNPARTNQFDMGDAVYPQTYISGFTNKCYAYYSLEVRTTDDVIIREYDSATSDYADFTNSWLLEYSPDSPHEIPVEDGKYYRLDASRTSNTTYRSYYIDLEIEIEPLDFTDTYIMLNDTLNFKGNGTNNYSMNLGAVDFYDMAREGYANSTGISGQYFTLFKTGSENLAVYDVTTNKWVTDDYPQCKTFYNNTFIHNLAEQVWYWWNIAKISPTPIDSENPLPPSDDTTNDIIELLFAPITALHSAVLYDINGWQDGGEITIGAIFWTILGIILFVAFMRFFAGG